MLHGVAKSQTWLQDWTTTIFTRNLVLLISPPWVQQEVKENEGGPSPRPSMDSGQGVGGLFHRWGSLSASLQSKFVCHQGIYYIGKRLIKFSLCQSFLHSQNLNFSFTQVLWLLFPLNPLKANINLGPAESRVEQHPWSMASRRKLGLAVLMPGHSSLLHHWTDLRWVK